MALVLQDRVRETSTTTGTGTVTLGGAYDGYRTFASCVPDGSVVYYAIQNTGPGMEGEWEVGYGTFTLSGTTLSRTTVFSSSNANSLVNFSAGTKQVFITYPSEKAIYEEVNGTTLINAGPITVVGANVTSFTSLNAALGEFYANVNDFAQIYAQNQSSGGSASTDFVVENDLGTDTVHYADFGINSSGFSSVDYPIYTPNSGYLYTIGSGGANASTMFIGSGDGNVVIHTGGFNSANVVVTLGTNKSANFTGNVAAAGTFTANGAATFGSTVLLNADPIANLQAATKQYVDQQVSSGLDVHEAVRLERGSNLTATYNNGTSGVGATLTNSGTQVALSIDGVATAVNDRILVYGQTDPVQNGVYTVTNIGSGSTNWVLTRATDADTYGTSGGTQLSQGSYFYVTSGNTGAGESYVCSTTGTITFGTTAITFSQFSASPTYTGGTNINVSAQTISLDGTVAATNGGTGANTVTTGDLLYGSGTNTWGKLAKGSAYRSLVMDASGTNVEWNAIALNQGNAVSGTLDETNGGTGLSTYTTGDTVYASATNTLSKLGGNTTTTKKFLQQTGDGVNSAAPAWGQPAASDITGLAPSATTDTTNASNITSGTLPNARLVSVPNSALANSSMTINGTAISLGGSGTVTAAAGTLTGTSLPVTVTGSSLTSVGTVTSGTWSGSFGAVSGANLTTLNGSNISSGTVAPARLGSGTPSSANYLRGDGAWTAVPSPNNGTLNMGVSGTGLSGSATFTADQSGTSTFTVTSNATSLNTASAIVARDASGNFSAGTITATLSGNASTATSATSATTATTATNLANGGAGQIPYNTGSGATAFLAAGTAGYILQSNGTSAPSWIANQTGTVTSVAASAGTGISVSGSPITSSGTLTITNTGVTSIGGSGGITLSASTGSVTASPTSGYNGYGVRTVSTASPTGGSDGDVWYKY